jgi:2-methylisocitrate lyase-like PEP mutase family enzyme
MTAGGAAAAADSSAAGARAAGLAGARAAGAERLRAMHHGPRPLVLPNVWDPVSAGSFAKAGFAALATTSSGVAATLGYADGQTPGEEMLAAVARIARSVEVPVTADVEDGYGLPAAELADRLLAAGVVGCNLEDSSPRTRELADPGAQADFLAAVRAAAGHALVLNARVDVYVRPGFTGDAAVEEAVRRARIYLSAGADCVYPIIAPGSDLPRLVREIGGPVNAMQHRGGPTLAELAAFGVARITFGGGLQHRAAQFVHDMATELAADSAALGQS